MSVVSKLTVLATPVLYSPEAKQSPYLWLYVLLYLRFSSSYCIPNSILVNKFLQYWKKVTSKGTPRVFFPSKYENLFFGEGKDNTWSLDNKKLDKKFMFKYLTNQCKEEKRSLEKGKV